MCTVTYVPLPGGFALSSNRDESPLRAENPLITEQFRNQTAIFPRDTKGGSWLFASDRGEVICVLNGAQFKHKHQPPYRLSRGLIARSYFEYDDPKAFLKEIDLRGIEPFTMILAGSGWLYVLRWNEREKSIDILDPNEKHIWSSSTLYTPEMTQRRKDWFEQFVDSKSDLNMEDIHFIHRNGSVGDSTQDYVMNRMNIVRTVSISHVRIDELETRFNFENLMHHTSDSATLPRKNQ